MIELVEPDPIRVDGRAIQTLRELKGAIPHDQHVVVEGKVDLLRHSNRIFTLLLDAGVTLRGVLGEEIDLEAARGLWGQRARVEGRARFRPSGTVLRLDTEGIGPARDDRSVFSEVPRPLFGAVDERSRHRPQGPRSGLAAIIGQWPGDETDAEFDAALADLS